MTLLKDILDLFGAAAMCAVVLAVAYVVGG